MQQNDLNRAVSRATGETVTTVKQLGFVLDDPGERLDEPAHTIDWDDLDKQRQTSLFRQPDVLASHV